MKRAKVFSSIVCLLTFFTVIPVLAFEVERDEIIQGISSEIEALPDLMKDEVQTSTNTLDETVWEVDVITIPPTVKTTATLIFSDGMLTITDWIAILGPAVYTEKSGQNSTFFSATVVKKMFGQNITYQIKGLAKLEKRIAGLIQNTTWDIFYVFHGDPLIVREE